MKKRIQILLSCVFIILGCCATGRGQKTEQDKPGWPGISKETKPWARWWWMGSAVDEPNLTRLMKVYAEAGFGGVEVTPIYGAMGFEAKYLDFLSPGWMKMLDVSVREAGKNGMGVDMNLGTGWPFGGPQINYVAAASKLILQKYQLHGGEQLTEKLIPHDPRQVAAKARLDAVTAYGPGGKVIDLSSKVDPDGMLKWVADNGEWQVYAAFSGKTLQKVKRSAPGGEGLVLDHFSKSALNTYLSRFDSAFKQSNHGIRMFFNDSYEAYGTNWTPSFLAEFKERRGYPLETYLRELDEKIPSTDVSRRIQCDYRETISDILLSNFTRPWTQWAHEKGSRTRNQAHGSPGNLLDLYAAIDIPECETFGSSHFAVKGLRRDSADVRNVDPDPVMLKFASSAAHVSGKKLASSETFTWLAEHFRVSLSQCKPEVEQAFLSGVNHVLYHGMTYSPAEAGWPGWLFYASVNFAPSNSFWPHLKGLNQYITRCQSVLQSGTPDNDLLVYWPVYDIWMNPGNIDLQLAVHTIDKWLYPSAFYRDVKEWMNQGYSLDFVSDRLLNELTVKNGLLVTPSGSSYRSLVIPSCKYMPGTTLRRILDLAKEGALVIFQQFPEDVPGYFNLDNRRNQQKGMLQGIGLKYGQNGIKTAKVGIGEIILSNPVQQSFDQKKIERETFVDEGLKFLRRTTDQGIYYYLVNHTGSTIDSNIPLKHQGNGYLLLDPQTGITGMPEQKVQEGKNTIRVQLHSGEAIFLLVASQRPKAGKWSYLDNPSAPVELKEPWKLTFTEGGAVIPKPANLKQLVNWTDLPDEVAHDFSGSAVYETSFQLPEVKPGEYLLDLGRICESGHVWVNGKDAGILWSIPFTARITKFLKPGTNELKIEVANLMANRIRLMDQQKIPWRKYHEINFVDINYKPFDASKWNLMPSGLLGPVTIQHFQ